jgi:hypothetical protein
MKEIIMQYGNIKGAHVLNRVNLGLNSKETLKFALTELGIHINTIENNLLHEASVKLHTLCRNANEKTGYTVSIYLK